MGAIVLDASKVNSYVLPNLVKSKNTMQDAYSTSQSLRNSLPSSFTFVLQSPSSYLFPPGRNNFQGWV